MPYGYMGKVLHVDLSSGSLEVETPPDAFYRTYMGGSGLNMHYLLNMIPAGADALGPENVLALSVGTLTGAPISGLSRVMANAKSPLTGAIGDSQAGGFWPAECKFAGFDAVIVRGRAERPVYLWIHDGEAEIRDAGHLWGKVTGEAEDAIRAEHRDPRVQVLQIGPAGERLTRFAALINYANRANGRTGMGAVMGSKNLKAIAVRGHARPEIADPERLRELARWGRDHFEESGVYGMGLNGTANGVRNLQETGALPTRNWSSGVFEGWEALWGETMTRTILKERDTCYGCLIRCKRVVEVNEGPYRADPRYGGPEYETIAAMGSYCGVDDLAAISQANEICNKYGMDTISCGAAVAFAMDCFERGILTLADTGGVDLRFGNAAAMVVMVQAIADRRGLGDLLAEGSYRAAREIGKGAEDLVVACKKQDYPAHVPQAKRSLALIYAVNPFGADHQSHEHDPSYAPSQDKVTLDHLAMLGLIHPQEARDLSEEKVRFSLFTEYLYSALDCLGTCQFAWGPTFQLYGPDELVDGVRAITGWQTSLAEILQVGERRLNMLRAFNAREGFTAEDDVLPKKGHQALVGGATDGVRVTEDEFLRARAAYYRMAGWDEEGVPRTGTLERLGLGWVAAG
jgi:aldehyde:ferredoxin oxidoreductase